VGNLSRLRLYKLGSLLGLLAILMSTLAPTISQVLASQDRVGQALETYCTADPTSDPGEGDRGGGHKAFQWQACAYCGLFAHMPAMPGWITPVLGALVVARVQVIVARSVLRAAAPHTLAQSRAPPVFLL
jgi:hypothetical protein